MEKQKLTDKQQRFIDEYLVDLVTDNTERVAAHAQSMLSRLRGYDDWIACADKDRLDVAKQVFGDLRVFYDRFIAELISLSEVKC